MTERGGEVQVAVRTPDSRLAGALREDLPSLSTRLEQTGFRAETWHTASAATADRRQAGETITAAPPQQDRSPSDGGRQDGHPQHKDQQHPNRKENRKDFAWLFTSIR